MQVCLGRDGPCMFERLCTVHHYLMNPWAPNPFPLLARASSPPLMWRTECQPWDVMVSPDITYLPGVLGGLLVERRAVLAVLISLSR